MSTPLSGGIAGAESIGTGSHSSDQRPSKPARPVQERPAEAEVAPPDAGQRLTIRAEGDSYIYTVLDRRRGEVVAQVSHDEVAHMGERAGYAAGALIKAKA